MHALGNLSHDTILHGSGWVHIAFCHDLGTSHMQLSAKNQDESTVNKKSRLNVTAHCSYIHMAPWVCMLDYRIIILVAAIQIKVETCELGIYIGWTKRDKMSTSRRPLAS